jgi:hypothetical protein
LASNRWDENVPSGSSAINLGDDDIRSLTTSLRIGLDDEHHWDSTLGDANRGTHRLGSARAYVDNQSNLSASGTSYTGRLYWADDTGRLFVTPNSGVTAFSGSTAVIECGTSPGQNARWVVQRGTVNTGADNAIQSRTFSPTYDASPVVNLTSEQTDTGQFYPILATIEAVSASAVTFTTIMADSGASALAVPVHWAAFGYVTFT